MPGRIAAIRGAATLPAVALLAADVRRGAAFVSVEVPVFRTVVFAVVPVADFVVFFAGAFFVAVVPAALRVVPAAAFAVVVVAMVRVVVRRGVVALTCSFVSLSGISLILYCSPSNAERGAANS
jgi:hypothetical protein